MRLILQDRFWVVNIPSVLMVAFQSFAQFPVDRLANPVVSSLTFFQCQVAAFAYYVIDYFVSVTT